MLKMIVMDLDGTLLTKEKKVSLPTREYLQTLKDKGYIITIATGRNYFSALIVTEGAAFANYIISDTGACAYDVKEGTEVFQNTIRRKTVESLMTYYNEACHHIDICAKDLVYRYSDIEKNTKTIKTTKDKSYILNHCKEVTHVSIAMKNNEATNALYHEIVKVFPYLDILIMQDSFSHQKWLDIMPQGCSKYKGIKELANYLKIASNEIIAFGDGLNDLEMLRQCHCGVALKNALPEVKAVADEVTVYDHNHDGVMNYLKEYIGIK